MTSAAQATVGGADVFRSGPLDREGFADACRQTHSALQWLARLCQSYRDPLPGERHLLLDWADARQAVVTPEFLPGITVELRLKGFFLHFREDGVPTPHPMVLDDCSPAEVEAWCLIELLHRNLDRDRFRKDLPYEVSTLMKGDADHFDSEGRGAEFEGLGALMAEAAAVLRRARPGPDTLRVAPQDFALCLEEAPGAGEIGLCLGDAAAEGPFFYRLEEGAGASTGGSTASTPRPARSRDARARCLALAEVGAEGLGAAEIADFLAGTPARA